MRKDIEGTMPADRTASGGSGSSGRRVAALWALLVALLLGVWLWLAFSSGGYATTDWAFPAVALGMLGVIIGVLVTYPRRPRQLSLAVLALVAAYALWAMASSLWAPSTGDAWQTTGRTFVYVLALALALSLFASSNARTIFRYLLMTGGLVLLIACIWRLWSADSLAPLFRANRFSFPIGQPDSAGALFLVPFWPLMWLAAGPEERAPVRGIAVGLATGLVGLALMTQSRAAAWSLGITLVLLFVLTPGRLRLLFYLVVPALLMVYAFPILNAYWVQGPETVSGGIAARTLTVAVLASGFIGMIVALLEKWVKVTGRMKALFGTIILAGCAAGLIYGAITLTEDAGGPMAWFGDRWHQLAGEPAPEVATGAAAPDGAGAPAITRAEAWTDAWRALQTDLAAGAGAGGAHGEALILRVLGDTGVVGGVLAFGVMLLSVAGIMWPRSAAGWRAARSALQRRKTGRGPADRWGREPLDYGWEMALLAGVALWFVQANLEPLWQMSGVTLLPLLMLAAALASTDSRARTMWPHLSRRLRYGPVRRPSSAAPDRAAAIDAAVDAPAATARRFRLRRPQPFGPLSDAFRIGVVVLSAAVVILAVSDYLLALV